MSSPRWPVVLFDLDGTLVDTVGLIISSFQHAWRVVFDEQLDAEVARSWIGRTLPDVFAPYGTQKASELNDAFVRYNIVELPRQQRNYPGVADVLAALASAGAAVGIVTSKRLRGAALSLEVAGIMGVPLLATLESTAAHKPDSAPLLYALDKLGRRPDETVYVGDAVVDVQAARAAGCSAVAVTWGAGERLGLEAARPDVLVHSAADLAAVLLRH